MKRSWGRMAREVRAGVLAMVVLTVLLGVVYPMVMTGIGLLVFPHQANGSLVTGADGQAAGSALIGQSFVDADGNPLPQYFQPRLSYAGKGYDPRASGGSNLGPENADLIARIASAKQSIAAFDGVAPSAVPPDAVTASASGLDPDISPEYAAIQVARVASARGMTPDQVRVLVAQHIQGRDLGYIGEPRVNVVELNLALDQRHA